MEGPLGARGRLLRGDFIEILLIAGAGLEQRFEIVLLHLLADHLLHSLCFKNLVGLLLRAQLDQTAPG